jgi:hypothetical protein
VKEETNVKADGKEVIKLSWLYGVILQKLALYVKNFRSSNILITREEE